VTRDLRALLEAEGVAPSTWGNGPHDRYEEHRHTYDKVVVAEAGSIVFRLPGGPVELRVGDRLELPSGTPHAAEVGPEGVTCLEAHLPSGSLGRTPQVVAGWAVSAGAAAVDPRDRAVVEGEGPAEAADQ
jgi:hypothetical protein